MAPGIRVRIMPGAWVGSRLELTRLLTGITGFLGLQGELELTVASDAEVARLNREHLSVPGPTNILSFPDGDPGRLGELVLSGPAVAREAFLYGQDPWQHLVRLLAHGLLHLGGHEHGEVMDGLTEEAVARFGREGVEDRHT